MSEHPGFQPSAPPPSRDLITDWPELRARVDLDDSVSQGDRAFLGLTTPIVLVGDTALVAAPDEFIKTVLETRLKTAFTTHLGAMYGQEIRIAVTVESSPPPPPQTAMSAPSHAAPLQAPWMPPPAPIDQQPYATHPTYADHYNAADPAPQVVAPRSNNEHIAPFNQQSSFGRHGALASAGGFASASDDASAGTKAQQAKLNEKYVFETFVIGSSNRFAHAAAVAVAEAPAKAYNPLFIYGDSGLGKTHLLHAIGHYARNLYPGTRVRYVSTEEFTNDFINAIRDGKGDLLRRRYRDVDILMVDDIQFLENKEGTQEEFFHTFNTLHNASKQIVISSDRPPKQLNTLEDRLRSRFEWGLITDIQPPELETRIAILRKKAQQEGLNAPPEVLEFIASKISTNIRELEGALIRVTAFASLNRAPVDLSLAEIVLKDLMPDAGGPEITAPMIMAQTAMYFGITMDDLCGTSRSRILVTARQIAMYLCRELTDLSLPKIGQQFGGRFAQCHPIWR